MMPAGFRISPTLCRYIARNYLWNLLGLFAALLFIIYLFDMVELIRRASKRDDIPFALVIQMGLLKLPEVAQIISPFAI
ncbi:MAG TPA: LptF/LptG family permease, partial [Alphaproteobacteria bacterium]|nr:LptF/LptG family permease [Alphaproteobacteria bacterium]